MIVVLDANVIVSGIARYAKGLSAPVRVVRAAVDGEYRLVLSDGIVGEATFALTKTYFGDRLDERDVAERLLQFKRAGRMVTPSPSIHGIATHWHDDRVLATALEGQADYLVTGDKELLSLDHPFPFEIIHPREFLAILEGDETDE
jgi:uncharacterized protein